MKPLVSGVTVALRDARAVPRLVARVEHARQNGLPDAFTQLLRREASWTVPHGDPPTGLEAINAFARRWRPSPVHPKLTLPGEAERLVLIRPELARVKIRRRPIIRDELPVAIGRLDPRGALIGRRRDRRPRRRGRGLGGRASPWQAVTDLSWCH
ncbi:MULTISPECIES: hypothetical protein [unclassified Streptomyces]|uniref:hypothetical protein n=1 Tax=unclassified Streptomyces TaxID=2593676 RepID=UPI001F117367|nr:hypothetical protein [Streptomyces sp. A1136]